MLPNLQNITRSLLLEHSSIPALEVDVRFEAPTRQWASSLFRPTISLFLYDVQENLELRHTAFNTWREGNTGFSKAEPRLYDFRFLVSAFATEIEDEHAIFWRVLHTLLRFSEFPSSVFPEGWEGPTSGIFCRIDQHSEGSSKLTDIWSGLEVHPRPALSWVVTLPVDTESVFDAPLVFTRNLGYKAPFAGAGAWDRSFHIGGVVSSKSGDPLEGVLVGLEGSTQEVRSDGLGRFVFSSVQAGRLGLRVIVGKKPKVFELVVPSDSYDVIVD
jgi:Pvc16 N-terminal domain